MQRTLESRSRLAGLGLRTPHARELERQKPPLALVEVHSENYFGGGAARALLERVRGDYAVSMHGVGMSLGGVDPLDPVYLATLKRLCDEVEPQFVSDHACFTSFAGRHVHDLLPLPYTEEALDHMTRRVAEAQHRLGRRLLVENPSLYIRYPHATLSEPVFLGELSRRTGCGLLLDVNNVYVSSRNLGFDAVAYLGQLPVAAVCELHLAGYSHVGGLLLDTHSMPVHGPVWALFQRAAWRFPSVPAIVEWDSDLPAFDTLLGEVERAHQIAADALARQQLHAELCNEPNLG